MLITKLNTLFPMKEKGVCLVSSFSGPLEGLLQLERILHKLLETADADALQIKLAQLLKLTASKHSVSGDPSGFSTQLLQQPSAQLRLPRSLIR